MMTVSEARELVVKDYLINLEKQRDEDLFAPHVTAKDKEEYFKKKLKWIEDVAAGKEDSNFTVWQRINEYITGECIPLFSK